MPRTLIDEGELREVYHYRPAPSVVESGDPVLLVTPLAAPALCFDLRRGCSLVEHFVSLGRRDVPRGVRPGVLPQPQPRDGALGRRGAARGHPGGVRARRRSPGAPGRLEPRRHLRDAHGRGPARPADRVAHGRRAPRSTSTRCRWWRRCARCSTSPTGAALLTRRLPGAGRAPAAAGQVGLPAASACRRSSPSRWRSLTHLDDTDYLAQLEAVDRFMANMIAYPGRTFGQLYHRFVKGNALSRPAPWSSATAPSSWPPSPRPVLVFAGATDGIAPVAAVRPVVALLSGLREVRFEIVPGGHLGMLTGRAARGTTWRVMDEWIEQWSSPDARREASRPGRPPPRRLLPRRPPPRRQRDQEDRRPSARPRPARTPARRTARPGPRRDRRQPEPPLRLGGLARAGALRSHRRAPCAALECPHDRADPTATAHARCRAACGRATGRGRWRPARSGPCRA